MTSFNDATFMWDFFEKVFENRKGSQWAKGTAMMIDGEEKTFTIGLRYDAARVETWFEINAPGVFTFTCFYGLQPENPDQLVDEKKNPMRFCTSRFMKHSLTINPPYGIDDAEHFLMIARLSVESFE